MLLRARVFLKFARYLQAVLATMPARVSISTTFFMCVDPARVWGVRDTARRLRRMFCFAPTNSTLRLMANRRAETSRTSSEVGSRNQQDPVGPMRHAASCTCCAHRTCMPFGGLPDRVLHWIVVSSEMM